MIRSKDVNSEVKKLEDLVVAENPSDIDLLKGILKANLLQVKLSRDIRTNQGLIMKDNGIDLIKDKNAKKE